MLGQKGLELDKKALVRRAIAISDSRDVYFNDMIQKFREKFPGLKLVYANNTMGAVLNPDHPTSDYLLIFKGQLVSTDRRKPTKDIMMVSSPMIFSELSIAGWTMAVEEGNLSGFFEYMLDQCLRIDYAKFFEYVQHMALLSTDPKSDRYWKRLENTETLTKELQELYTRYNKKRSTKLQDRRGFKTASNQQSNIATVQANADRMTAPAMRRPRAN